MDLPAQGEPQLNIYGFLYAGEPTLLMLSKASPYNHPQGRGTRLQEARIKYYINGTLVEEQRVTRTEQEQSLSPAGVGVTSADLTFIYPRTRYQNTNAHLWYKSKCQPKAGDKVQIEVHSPGLPVARFEVTLPPMPEVREVRLEEVDLPSDYFLLESLQKQYENSITYYRARRGWAEGYNPFPPFEDLVQKGKARLLSFKVPSSRARAFYAIGSQARLTANYTGGIGMEPSDEELVYYLVSHLLFDLNRLLYIEGDLSFSLRAREIARQRLEEHDQPGYFQPYFTTEPRGKEEEISLLLPSFTPAYAAYGVDRFDEIALTTLDPSYADLAEQGYGILKPRKTGSLTDLDFGDLLAEHALERCNLTDALGFIYVASPRPLALQ